MTPRTSPVGVGGPVFPIPAPVTEVALGRATGSTRRYSDHPTMRLHRAAEIDLDVVLVMDDSGSTFSTDPHDHRYVAARRLVRALLRSGGWQRSLRAWERGRTTAVDRAVLRYRAWAADRVAVISFTGRVTRTLEPQLLPDDLAAVFDVLEGPGPSGGTSLGPALHAAATVLGNAEHRPGRLRRQVVLVFTDGEVFDDPADLAGAVARLAPASIHIVVLGVSERAREHLAAAGLTEVEGVASLADPRALEHLLTRATGEATRPAVEPAHQLDPTRLGDRTKSVTPSDADS